MNIVPHCPGLEGCVIKYFTNPPLMHLAGSVHALPISLTFPCVPAKLHCQLCISDLQNAMLPITSAGKTAIELTPARNSSWPMTKRELVCKYPSSLAHWVGQLRCVLYTVSQSFLHGCKLQLPTAVLGLITCLDWLPVLLHITFPFPPGAVYTPQHNNNYTWIFVSGSASVKMAIPIILNFSILTCSPPVWILAY